MRKIDILNLSKYLRRKGDNKLARVGHVNYALGVTNQITTNVFANNAAAIAAGLQVGDLYSTDGTGVAPLNVAGIVMVVV